MHSRFEKMDNYSKLLILAMVVVAVFLVFQLLFPQQVAGIGRGRGMPQTNPTSIPLLTIGVLVALGAGYFFWEWMRPKQITSTTSTGTGSQILVSRETELQILKKALNEDEKRVLDEVEKAKEITQDSLRFRLEWSKAKLSAILSNLDKKGLVQRERSGKTYRVFLEKTAK